MTLTGVHGQTKIDTAKFTKILMLGKDTLTFYIRQSNCDTVTFYKYQICKPKKDFVIKSFYRLEFKQPKKCKDLLTVNPENLNFKQYQTCDHDVGSVGFINEIELAIRNIKHDNSYCTNNIKFLMTIGSKKHSNKNRTCRQELTIKIHNYFGCVLVDPDTKSIE